jgi:GNAT superfamily N-acetyltransferase
MNLLQASDPVHWEEASCLLREVRTRLESMGAVLWTEAQTTPARLAMDYPLEQLHFLEDNSMRIGIVVLMDHDPLFWPELEPGAALFVHKLAIHPVHCGKGLGKIALDTIVEYAGKIGHEWVRLDCDDRPALHQFYQAYGFSLVDIKPVGPFVVGRYKLRVTPG